MSRRHNGTLQHDNRDCGAACLATILHRYKLEVPLVHIREKMHTNRNGASIYDIINTAEKYNLQGNALHGNWQDFESSIKKGCVKLPLIAHLTNEDGAGHFVVVDKISSGSVKGFDPASGEYKWSFKEFCDRWTGYVIELIATDKFQKGNYRRGTFKKYFSVLVNLKRVIAVVILLSLILAGISIVCALVYQQLFDSYVMKGNTTGYSTGEIYGNLTFQMKTLFDNMETLFVALIAIYIIQMILEFARNVLLAYVTKKSLEVLSLQFCKHLIELPIVFFQDRETGEIISRYNNIDEIQDFLSTVICSLIINVFMTFAGGVVLISISKAMFLVVLLMTVSYSIIVLLYRKPVQKITRKVMESDSKVVSELNSEIEGIQTIKVFSGEVSFHNRMMGRLRNYLEMLYSGNIIVVSQGCILGCVECIGTALILWTGCRFVLSGILSIGDLIAFMSLVYYFLSPVISLIGLQPQIQQAYIAAERLDDILEIEKEDVSEKRFIDIGGDIEVKNVSFSYNASAPILNDVSFEVNCGEKIAIVGSNGCGKTTLMKLISSLYPVSNGKIIVGNQDLSGIPLYGRRKQILFIDQDVDLFTGTLGYNLKFDAKVSEDEIKEVVKGCCLDKMIQRLPFGYDTAVDENGKNFSSGEKQRIAIARALLAKPKIMLFDESTSNLDLVTEQHILDFIWERYSGNTCFFTAHRKEIIVRCDRVLFLCEGRIEAFGPHENIMKNSKPYNELVNAAY